MGLWLIRKKVKEYVYFRKTIVARYFLHILKKVCFMTTSFPCIHFFSDSVIISREHLQKSTCQENCVYFTTLFTTIHYNNGSVVDSKKSWRVCLFQENHCGPALLKLLIYSTELVAIIFFEKFCVKCTKALSYRDPILSWWTSIVKLASLFQKF